jgi:replication-associated recombination protein RarA
MSRSYDPWQSLKTKNGLNADEVISGIQKSIRRGKVEDAIACGWEMYITSEEMENLMWLRLQVMSVEDIGFGDVNAPVLIRTLNEMRKEYSYNAVDRALFFVHAVRYLCSCTKDRSSDMLKNIVEKEFAKGRRPEIRDYMLDMHTRRGQEMKRDVNHFLSEASKVIPEKPGAHDEYLPRLLKLLEEEK